MHFLHTPVLLEPVLEAFKHINNGTIVDCTLGYGGHSKAILDSNKKLKIIACDKDNMALKFSLSKFKDYEDRIKIYKSNFSNIINKIDQGDIRGILADIGLSSPQLDNDKRGFSLNSNYLDMRMDTDDEFDALKLINSYSQIELERIFHEYGELPNAKSIAKKIIEARAISKINSARQLTNIIGKFKLKNRSISIATLAFQAIRIEINKELDALEKLLISIQNSNIDDATIALISFHSLEDKIIKNYFKAWEKNCICPKTVYKCLCGNNHKIGKIITKKPIIATDLEVSNNSKSSCAKLRIFHILREQ